jgi:hypothetical protein
MSATAVPESIQHSAITTALRPALAHALDRDNLRQQRRRLRAADAIAEHYLTAAVLEADTLPDLIDRLAREHFAGDGPGNMQHAAAELAQLEQCVSESAPSVQDAAANYWSAFVEAGTYVGLAIGFRLGLSARDPLADLPAATKDAMQTIAQRVREASARHRRSDARNA